MPSRKVVKVKIIIPNNDGVPSTSGLPRFDGGDCLDSHTTNTTEEIDKNLLSFLEILHNASPIDTDSRDFRNYCDCLGVLLLRLGVDLSLVPPRLIIEISLMDSAFVSDILEPEVITKLHKINSNIEIVEMVSILLDEFSRIFQVQYRKSIMKNGTVGTRMFSVNRRRTLDFWLNDSLEVREKILDEFFSTLVDIPGLFPEWCIETIDFKPLHKVKILF